ncbi:MAG: hypothetical protein AB7V14_10605 [Kiritimatiellia bacterium]
MTDPAPSHPESDVLPPEPGGALSIPPPVPQKKPGFLRRLFTSRKKQQAVAMQNGYLEMVDLIRAIRSHLDRQENVQTRVLTMLEKVPDAMDRQHEVMTLFKQQLENGMENNRRLTDSMGNLNHTLASMDESQKASSRTVTDLIHRSRESEQLLREVMRRSERRMTALVVFFFLAVVALGFYFVRGAGRAAPAEPAPALQPAAAVQKAADEKPAVAEIKADEPAAGKAEFLVPADPAKEEKKTEETPAPAKKEKSKKKSKAKPEPKPEVKTESPPVPAESSLPPAATPVAEEPAIGQPDLALDQIKQIVGDAIDPAGAPQPVSVP